ncbi:MAG: 3'-5' exonuclease [Bacteroidetes bacterium]|jgi:DNA polymerase III alpha subunit (gram-positive type)|nr:3'-5' exonuclease [Bacteroidota bacterium]
MNKISDLRILKPAIKTSLELASLLFFDIETTGLRPDRGAKITEVAILNRNSSQFCWEKKSVNETDNCSLPLQVVLEHLQQGIVVGHNLRFDFWFLAYEADRLGLDGPNLRFIDTLDLSRQLRKEQDSFKLNALLKEFDIRVEGDLHTAVIDAEATRAIFWKLIEFGEISTVGEAGAKQLNWANF